MTVAALLRFLAALAVGALGGALFWSIGAPLPWMLGSMAACAIASIAGAPVAASAATRRPMAAVIGVVLGSSFRPDLFDHARAWIVPLALLPLFLASAALLCVTYFRRVAKFDPATAYFAGMPGGIAEMVVMGSERGADERTVGLIHAARIFMVVFALPFLIRLVATPAEIRPIIAVAGNTTEWELVGWTVGCVVVGLALGRLLRLQAWHLVGPLAVSAAVHMTGVADFRFPHGVWRLLRLGSARRSGAGFPGFRYGLCCVLCCLPPDRR